MVRPDESRYVVDSFMPAYTRLARDELERRVVEARRALEYCEVCPRACHVNRLQNEIDDAYQLARDAGLWRFAK